MAQNSPLFWECCGLYFVRHLYSIDPNKIDFNPLIFIVYTPCSCVIHLTISVSQFKCTVWWGVCAVACMCVYICVQQCLGYGLIKWLWCQKHQKRHRFVLWRVVICQTQKVCFEKIFETVLLQRCESWSDLVLNAQNGKITTLTFQRKFKQVDMHYNRNPSLSLIKQLLRWLILHPWRHFFLFLCKESLSLFMVTIFSQRGACSHCGGWEVCPTFFIWLFDGQPWMFCFRTSSMQVCVCVCVRVCVCVCVSYTCQPG